MRDTLPKRPKKIECAILNLDTFKKPGTHWVAYAKINDYCEYFNSFGNLKPPSELINYMKQINITYNYKRYQSFDTYNGWSPLYTIS